LALVVVCSGSFSGDVPTLVSFDVDTGFSSPSSCVGLVSERAAEINGGRRTVRSLLDFAQSADRQSGMRPMRSNLRSGRRARLSPWERPSRDWASIENAALMTCEVVRDWLWLPKTDRHYQGRDRFYGSGLTQ